MMKQFLLSVVLVLSLLATPASSLLALAQTNGDGETADAPQRSIEEVERELKSSIEERILTLERQVYDQNELNLRRIEYGEERVDSFERSLDRILLMFGLSLLLGFFLLGNVLSYKQRMALQRLGHATGDAENIMRDIKREITRPELEHLRISQVLRRLMRQLREKSDSSFTPEAITELRAAANDPYLPASLHFIARVLTAEQDGNWNVALQMLDQLREMDSKDPDVLLHLSHVHNNIAARTVDVRQKRSHQRWAYEFYAQFTALIKMDGIESAELPTLKNMKASGVADDSPLPAIAPATPAPPPTPIPPIATTAAAASKARAPEKKSGVLETKPAQPIPQPQYQPYPAGQIPRQESRTPQEAREAREARIAARKAQKKNTIPQSKPPIVAPAPAKASKPPPRPKPAAVKPPPLPPVSPITPIPAVKPQTAAPAAAKAVAPPPATATETKPAPTPATALAATKPPPPATDTKPATPAAETKPTPATAETKPAAAPTPAPAAAETKPAAIVDPTKPQPAAAKLASKPPATTKPAPAAASPTPLPDPTKPQPAAAKQEQPEPAKKPEPIIVETKPPATTKPAPIIVDSPKPPAATIPAPTPPASKPATANANGNGATPPAAAKLSKTRAPQQTASGETSLAASDFESSQDGKKRSFQDKLSSLRSMQKEKIVNASKNIVAAVGEMSSPMEGIRSLRNLVQAENEGELPFLPIPSISEVPESGEPKVIHMWEETRKGDMQMTKAMTAKTLRERNRMIDQAMVFYAQAQMYKTDQVLYHNWGLALLAKALHVESKKRAPFFNAAVDKFLAGNVIAPHYFDFRLASLYAIIGDKDKCYHWLKESRESGKLDVESLQHAVDFDSVRREKWFDEFLTT